MPEITTKTVGAGGSWKVLDERPDPSVVKQLSPHSCVAAVGERLLRSRGISMSQEAIIDIIGELSTPEHLANVLNGIDSVEWFGGFIDPDNAEALHDRYEFAAVFRDGQSLGHMVFVTHFTSNVIYILDPWKATCYKVELEKEILALV